MPRSHIVRSVPLKTRRYELRYVECGKPNCRPCTRVNPNSPIPPGHGPYWYLIVTTQGTKRSIYIGKELDTMKFITPEGWIDWDAIKARDRARRDRRKAS